MLDYLGVNAAATLAYAIVAAILAITLLRWFDRSGDIDWRMTYQRIYESPAALAIYHGARIAAVFVAIALLVGCSPAQAAPIPSTYDRDIERAVDRWWPPGSDARWWKAQLYQESRLDPDAVSPAGARGLAQFMPATWAEISARLGYGGLSPHLAEPAIDAGAFYMARLWANWTAPRPASDRWDLARASYNAGLGNLLKAQQRCGGPPGFAAIMACLPDVTGHHARETITYVARIHRWYGQLMLCPRC